MPQEQMPFQNPLGGEQMMRGLSICLICTLLIFLRTVKADEKKTDANGGNNSSAAEVSDLKKMEHPFTFFLDTATSSLNGRYLWQNPEKSPAKFGIDLGGAAVNGIQSIWGGEDNTSEYTANIFMAFPINRNANEAAPVPNPKMVVELGISRSNYTFLEDTMSDGMSDKTRTQTQTSPSMFLYYSRNLRNDVHAGVSIGYTKLNNYATLPIRQLVESRANASTDSENTTEGSTNSVILKDKELTAREGDYEEFDALQTSFDLLFIPELEQYKIAFNLFFNYTFRGNNDHLFEPGFGIFSLIERKSPDTQNKDSNPRKEKNPKASDEVAPNSRNDNAVSVPFPTNILMLERTNAPWQIAYGVIGQWKDDLDEFRFGIVAGYNF